MKGGEKGTIMMEGERPALQRMLPELEFMAHLPQPPQYTAPAAPGVKSRIPGTVMELQSLGRDQAAVDIFGMVVGKGGPCCSQTVASCPPVSTRGDPESVAVSKIVGARVPNIPVRKFRLAETSAAVNPTQGPCVWNCAQRKLSWEKDRIKAPVRQASR